MLECFLIPYCHWNRKFPLYKAKVEKIGFVILFFKLFYLLVKHWSHELLRNYPILIDYDLGPRTRRWCIKAHTGRYRSRKCRNYSNLWSNTNQCRFSSRGITIMDEFVNMNAALYIYDGHTWSPFTFLP